jgi:hypothetical protein
MATSSSVASRPATRSAAFISFSSFSSSFSFSPFSYFTSFRMPDIKAEAIDDLTEAEVVELVKNFRGLDKEDQKELIEYMRKLEETDPERVQRLKRGLYV